jgi:hypothetical protein
MRFRKSPHVSTIGAVVHPAQAVGLRYRAEV